MRSWSWLVLFAIAACNPAPPPAPVPGEITTTGTPVVTVDGVTVTSDMVDAFKAKIPKDKLEPLMADKTRMHRVLGQLGMNQALYKRAIDQGLQNDPQVQLRLALAARDTLANELLDKVGNDAVTDATVQTYYDEHKVQYARPSVNLSEITLKPTDKALAEDLVKQLKGGADFATLAQQYSLDKGGKSGTGNIGWKTKGSLLPALDGPAFAANKGDVPDPVITDRGVFVLRIEDKRDSTPITEVRDEISDALRKEAISAYVKKLQEESKFEWADPEEAKIDEQIRQMAAGKAGGMPPGAMPPGGMPPGMAPQGMPPGMPPMAPANAPQPPAPQPPAPQPAQ